MEISEDTLNILFVVLAVVVGLISTFNKKKRDAEEAAKRKAKKEDERDFPEEKNIWETLQKELQGETEQPEDPEPERPVIVPQPVQVIEMDSKPLKKTQQPFIPVDMEVKGASLTQTPTEVQPILEEPVSEASAIDFSDPEELKKAVIYSEILHPKYLE